MDADTAAALQTAAQARLSYIVWLARELQTGQAVDLIQQEAAEALLQLAGLDEASESSANSWPSIGSTAKPTARAIPC